MNAAPPTTAPGPPRAPDRSPAPRRFQAVWVGIGMLSFFPGVYAMILRLFPPTDDVEALTASFIPYGLLFSAVSLICFLIALVRAHHRVALAVISIVTAALLAWQTSWQLPLFVADGRKMSTPPITVVSLNMRAGSADQAELIRRTADADIVVLVETTPSALRQLRDGAFAERFGNSQPGDGAVNGSSAIFSRFPLSDPEKLPTASWQMWSAVASVPQVGDLTVVAAHPCNPFCGKGKWQKDHRVVEQYVRELTGPVLLAGDFNAVDDHGPMRRLARDGFVSATDIAGAGWLPTYPSNSSIPPLIGIDHILINDRLTATSVSSFAVSGTDHRGLRAVIGGTR